MLRSPVVSDFQAALLQVQQFSPDNLKGQYQKVEETLAQLKN